MVVPSQEQGHNYILFDVVNIQQTLIWNSTVCVWGMGELCRVHEYKIYGTVHLKWYQSHKKGNTKMLLVSLQQACQIDLGGKIVTLHALERHRNKSVHVFRCQEVQLQNPLWFLLSHWSPWHRHLILLVSSTKGTFLALLPPICHNHTSPLGLACFLPKLSYSLAMFIWRYISTRMGCHNIYTNKQSPSDCTRFNFHGLNFCGFCGLLSQLQSLKQEK